MRVAAIQTTAGRDLHDNLRSAERLVEVAARDEAQLVVLPEYFSVAGAPEALRAGAEAMDGPTVTWAAGVARRFRLHLVAGSFPERHTDGEDRLANTCCVVGPDGGVTAVYRKIHLFDAVLGDAAFCESATIAPGEDVVTTTLDGGAVVGLSLCYDLRFPELYRVLALGGATIVAVPAAFTAATGPDHWELLLRARAVEEQVFVIGAGQVGRLPAGMPRCHGHSMIVDPWGTVLAVREDPTPGVVIADLDFEHLVRVRTELPVLANRRPGAYRGLHDDGRGRGGIGV